MTSPRVLQAQIQDLLDACRNDSRLKGTVEALEGALGTLSEGEHAAPASPGEVAARGETEQARSYYRPPPAGNDGPKSWREAREAAGTAMSEAQQA